MPSPLLLASILIAHDLSVALPIDANRLCILQPAANALFDPVARAKPTGPLTLPGGIEGLVTVTGKPGEQHSVEKTRRFRPSFRLTWHGLPVAFLQVRSIFVPESEGLSEVGIGLAVPLDRLDATLRAAGHPVARAPEYTRVELEPYDGAAQIERRDDAAFFSCVIG